MKGFGTGFETEGISGFFCETVKVVEFSIRPGNPGLTGLDRTIHASVLSTSSTSCFSNAQCRHAFAPSVRKHSSGHLLLSCRWDATGDAEGDASNEQALFFSQDNGSNWTMANEGRPIITLANGTPFGLRSAITHSFVFEDDGGLTWMYYTINQPNTWGAGKPDRSTGGGEIRKLQIEFDGDTWRAASFQSELVWGFMQPIDNGQGGSLNNVRVVSLNDIVRIGNHTWLLPVAGRATVTQPDGAYWRLNRCWVLESQDDGRSWSHSYWIGGGDGLCLCEPTIVKTAVTGHLVCYMRVQYDTGNQLYRSESSDYGHTWTRPYPSGLPNTGTSGTKPFLARLSGGDYLLLQTNEHSSSDRTNISIFRSDEAAFARNEWPLVKVLAAECRGHWEGSCYGWLEDAGAGEFYAAYVGFTPGRGAIHFARLSLSWLETTIIEPVSGLSSKGAYLPALSDQRVRTGSAAMIFSNAGGRLQATRFGEVMRESNGTSIVISLHLFVMNAPRTQPFSMLHASSDNGSQMSFAIALRPQINSHIWIQRNGGWLDSGIGCPTKCWFKLEAAIEDDAVFRVRVDEGDWIGDRLSGILFMESTNRPDSLWIGGPIANSDPCEIYVDDIYYGPLQ
jgi:hypothetical protein